MRARGLVQVATGALVVVGALFVATRDVPRLQATPVSLCEQEANTAAARSLYMRSQMADAAAAQRFDAWMFQRRNRNDAILVNAEVITTIEAQQRQQFRDAHLFAIESYLRDGWRTDCRTHFP